MTQERRYEFARGNVDLTITSIGSALGEERYELRGENERVFFTGANFSEFDVAERGGKLAIQLCRGFIDHAEPWSIGPDENLQLIRLDIDWNCREKTRES